jgi:hypothetical protein
MVSPTLLRLMQFNSDFGQTKFDNAILNLEPFEQRFDENKPFYRRNKPIYWKHILLTKIGVLKYSTKHWYQRRNLQLSSSIDLINAVKISGRTENGLGVGFFKCYNWKTFATITNTNTATSRKRGIEPLTNYNVIVLDQRFRQNSSVSFINTNVS